MKKSIKRISTLALSTLMAVSAIGGVTASAAETTTPEHEYRTIYFINNKEWNDVCAYMWDAPDMKYDNGEVVVEDMSGQPVVQNANFPGQTLDCIGTTTVLGEENEVYSITVDMSVYDAVVFSSPSTDMTWPATSALIESIPEKEDVTSCAISSMVLASMATCLLYASRWMAWRARISVSVKMP